MVDVSAKRETRRTAAEAVTEGLQPGLRTRLFIMNTLLADKGTDDRLRHYDSWIASRNLSNEASDASVQALVDAVRAGDTKTALAMIAKRINVNIPEPDGTTALHWAVRQDDLGLAEHAHETGKPILKTVQRLAGLQQRTDREQVFNDFGWTDPGERAGNGARLFRFYQDAMRFRRRHSAVRTRNIDIIRVNNT